MLNQSNKYFNYILSYLDQGGNNIWWSANAIDNTQAIAELIVNGQGLTEECIEASCIPICSEIIENEQTTIESLKSKQNLIYPIFSLQENQLIVKLQNLDLIEQPNYFEEGCINSDCTEEFGIWTKVIKTNNKVDIEGEIYYFIKANLDKYGFAYIYNLSLIHLETGQEISITKDKGLTSSTIYWDYQVPTGFIPVLYIKKFNIEQLITIYKFVDTPKYLRSDWNVNLSWQPLYNNTEEILFTILYLLHTDLEIEDKDVLILYKAKQQTLIEVLIQTITNITIDSSNPYSYIKNKTSPIKYNELVTNGGANLENLVLNPAIYSTVDYEPYQQNNTINILILLIVSIMNNKVKDSYKDLLNIYINKCINLELFTLKEEVLRIIAFTELYKRSKDIYHLSKVTNFIESINKRYKINISQYIESLDNPILTTESKVYGDLLEFYYINKEINIKDYVLEDISYVNDLLNNIYLTDQSNLLTNNPTHLLLLKLTGLNINTSKLNNNYKLINDVLNLDLISLLTTDILLPLDLYKLKVFSEFKSTIPFDFGWLGERTPIQDLIIKAITKPTIDLYLHSRYINDSIINKDALTINNVNELIINKEELLSRTLSDNNNIYSSLWPGKYSNSIDLEIKGYYDEEIIENVNDNIKSLGIEANLVSAIDLPLISNFDICFNITKLEDYRCQVDINGQLILLSDGQCDLAPPEVSVLLQETTDPITQETNIQDFILI